MAVGLAIVYVIGGAFVGAQTAHAATDIHAPLPGPRDFANLHSAILHDHSRGGLDMGRVTTGAGLYWLGRRVMLPVWLVWSMLTGPMP